MNEKSMICLTCLHRPWCRFCVMGRGLERRQLTRSGDRDDDRPRVFADHGYLIGDSTPLSVAKDRRTGMTFAAAVSMKGGGDPHAGRLLAKRIDGLGCQEVTVRTDEEPSICELIRRQCVLSILWRQLLTTSACLKHSNFFKTDRTTCESNCCSHETLLHDGAHRTLRID